MAKRVRLPGLPTIKTLQLATSYPTLEALADAFARFCEPEGCFVPTRQSRPIGMEAVFAIQLATGEPVLRGVCVVAATYDAATSPFGRAGLRLGIRSLTKDSRPRYAELLARKTGAPVEIHDNATVKTHLEPAYSTRPTVAMDPLADVDLVDQSAPQVIRDKLVTVLGFGPLRRPAAVERRGWLGRARDALVRLYRNAVSWRSRPSLPAAAMSGARHRSTSP